MSIKTHSCEEILIAIIEIISSRYSICVKSLLQKLYYKTVLYAKSQKNRYSRIRGMGRCPKNRLWRVSVRGFSRRRAPVVRRCSVSLG